MDSCEYLSALLPIALVGMGTTAGTAFAEPAERAWYRDGEARGHIAAATAHHLCAGMYVVGRDLERTAEEILAMDVARFPEFAWDRSFDFSVDQARRSATAWASGVQPPRTARYFGDQGCIILPAGTDTVFFEPVDVVSTLPDAATQSWPFGDRDAHGEFAEVDRARLDAALDRAMSRQDQNTRSLLVVYRGRIIGERYAEGFGRDTPQIGWSEGKSITAALVGVLAARGDIGLDQRAPIDAWQGAEDPRRNIRVRDLLNMSSGLEFENFDGDRIDAWSASNEHSRIYFDSINVFEHAINQPLELEPGSTFRYRNSDPLALGRIVRDTVEAGGGNYLAFPQAALFDRIGARTFVLETDAWGNFILTGYDYGGARDWARFGLLHLWDGIFEGDRVLAEGWVDFVRSPAPSDPGRAYGGLFWLNRGGAMDQVPEDAYWASGYMGQMTMIIPSADMVIVRLGPSSGGALAYMNDVIGQVLAAIGPRRPD